MTRKTYSDVKDSLAKTWTPVSCNLSWPCPHPLELWDENHLFDTYSDAGPFLGFLDTLFLFSYAIGIYISGVLGDRYDRRKLLASGMLLSAVLLFCFGVLTEWLHYYNKVLYAVLWCLQGLVQSVGWPSTVAVMANWFGKSNHGFVFGLWSACSSIGNIIGNAVTASLISYGYEYAFLCTSFMMLGGGFIVYFGLVVSPIDLKLSPPVEAGSNISPRVIPSEDNEDTANCDEPLLDVADRKDKAVTFCTALRLPGVVPYSLGYACIKLVNYAFFFWLPYYLTNNFGWSDSLADTMSTWYDVGGIIGGIIFGLISDCINVRSPVLVFMLSIAPFTLWGYKCSPNDVLINSVLMAVVGFFISGAANIISSTVAADLGKQPAITENHKAVSTVTGIVDGTGSIGASVGQYIVAVINLHYGWNWVFNFFIIMDIACLLCILPIFVKEVRNLSCMQTLVARTRLRSSNYDILS